MTVMRVLITGGCGFLGSNLASHFLSQGSHVVVADALFRKGSAQNLQWLQEQTTKDLFHFVQLDLADHDDVEALFRRYSPFDYICHVGGQVAMTTSLEDPRRDMRTNVVGTFNILEACRKYSPEALIAYSSTNKVYGDLEWLEHQETDTRYIIPKYPNGLDERLPLDFSTPYGCSKGSADQYVKDWARLFDVRTVVFRHSTIYGGRQFSSFDQGWIGWFVQKALEQKIVLDAGKKPEPFTIAGTGKQVRDVLFSSDLISLYQAAYEHRAILKGETFNIGGGVDNSSSLVELFDLLSNYLKIPGLVYSKTPRRSSDQDYFVADISKARQVIGWEPKVSKQEGIEKMVGWVSEIITK
jgi:CDP-paratose 2-epimerase